MAHRGPVLAAWQRLRQRLAVARRCGLAEAAAAAAASESDGDAVTMAAAAAAGPRWCLGLAGGLRLRLASVAAAWHDRDPGFRCPSVAPVPRARRHGGLPAGPGSVKAWQPHHNLGIPSQGWMGTVTLGSPSWRPCPRKLEA